MSERPDVCEHGGFRRKCPICERDEELAEKQAEIERLRESLAGMVESYDILINDSPLSKNELALGIIGGAFFGEIRKARACIAGETEGTP